MATPRGKYAERKYKQMMKLLDDLQAEVLAEWKAKAPQVMGEHMPKTLLVVDEDGLLRLNFDEEVIIILIIKVWPMDMKFKSCLMKSHNGSV